MPMPQSVSPLKPDALLTGSNAAQTERFQSLIEALVTEFQRLQQSREEAALENIQLHKQLHPIPPQELTFGSTGSSLEVTEDSLKSNGKQPLTWNHDKPAHTVVPVTPRENTREEPIEEQFHFTTPSKEQGKGSKGSTSGPSAHKPGPQAAAISSPLEAKEAPPFDDEATFLKDFDDGKAELSPIAGMSSVEIGAVGTSDDEELKGSASTAVFARSLRGSVVQKGVEKAKGSWGTVLLDTIPACVILANACTIGMSADVAPQSDVWDILEAIWIGFYFLEFMLKILLFGPYAYYFGRDRYWNWFDFTCLMVSLFDIAMLYILKLSASGGGATGLMKMLRLARLLRIVRALHYSFFDELKQMLLGVVSGVRVLIWAIILLLVVVFFLGVALQSLYGEDQPELESVPRAMLTVFRCYTDGCSAADGRPLQERLFDEYGAVFFFGYILSFMFVTVGIFNLIMAIFMDSVFSRSIKRKLHDLGSSAEAIEARVKESLALLIYEYAEEHPDWDQIDIIQNRVSEFSSSKLLETEVSINRDVFRSWLTHREFVDLLEEADVEAAAKAELFDVLDVDMGGELGLDELLNGLMKLRGPITKSDIIAVRLKVRYITGMIEDIWRRVANVTNSSKKEQEEAMKEVRRTTAFKCQAEAGEGEPLPMRNSGGSSSVTSWRLTGFKSQ